MPMYRKRKSPAQQAASKKTRWSSKKRLSIARSVNVRKDVHYFTRSFAQSVISGNVVNAPWVGAYSFSLSQLPGLTDFTTLFDRYKITHVQLKFYLKQDPSAQAAASAIYPKLYSVKDYDDATSPANVDELRQHSKCRIAVLHPNRPVTLNVKPAVLAQAYRGVSTVTYSPQWKTWIDMAQTDVPHYGLKLAIDDLTVTTYQVLVEGKMWFQCKDVR